jgi:hypothetical protein
MASLPVAPKPRNLRTQALNRRESFWQIYVPLGFAIIVVLAFMVMTVISAYSAGSLTHLVWADVSLIYLIIWAALGGLVVLALLIGLCAGLWYMLRELPPYFKLAQDFVMLATFRAAEISKQIANLFITPRASVAAAQKTLDSVRFIITPGRKG